MKKSKTKDDETGAHLHKMASRTRKKSERILRKQAKSFSNTLSDAIEIKDIEDTHAEENLKIKDLVAKNKESKSLGKKRKAKDVEDKKEKEGLGESDNEKVKIAGRKRKAKDEEDKKEKDKTPTRASPRIKKELHKENKHLETRVSKRVKVAGKKGKVQGKGEKRMKKDAKIREFFGIRTRTSPHKLFDVIKKLTKQQRNIVRRMGFGKLLSLKVEKITCKLAHFVVDKFDPQNMEIKLGVEKKIIVSKEAIQKLLGLPSGTLIISEENKHKRDPRVAKWKKRYPGASVSRVQIGKKIVENDYEEELLFKIDFMMLCTTILETSQNGNCLYTNLDWFDMDKTFNDYDWCEYTMDCLRKCKNEWNPNDQHSFFTGPLTFLVLLYLDSTTCHGIDNERTLAPIAFWTKERLEKREQQEIRNGGFGLGELRELYVDDQNYDIESEEENENKECESKSLKGGISMLRELCIANALEKKKLEEQIKDFKRKNPDNNELLSVITKYKDIYSNCLNFEDDVEEKGKCTKKTFSYMYEVQENVGASKEPKGKSVQKDDGLDKFEDKSSEEEVVDSEESNDEGNEDVGDEDVGSEGHDDEGDEDEDFEGNNDEGDEVGDSEDNDVEDDVALETPPVTNFQGKEDAMFESPDQEWTKTAIAYCEVIESVMYDVLGTEENHQTKKQKLTDDIPSFKLLSQDSQDSPNNQNIESTPTKTGKEECVNVEIEKTDDVEKTLKKKALDVPKKTKRKAKVSEYGKSPWLVRAVNIEKGVLKEEKMIWNYVLEGAARPKGGKKEWKKLLNKDGKPLTEEEIEALEKAENEKREKEEIARDFSKPAYQNSHGTRCMHYSLLDLMPHIQISTSIIDCWACVLNSKEDKRDDNVSTYRLFGHTGLFPQDKLSGKNYKDPSMLKHFKDELLNVVENKKEKLKLEDYTVVLFPILENKHYYLISFDLKNLAMTVIDNMLQKETVAKKSTQLKVRDVFVTYLKEVNHPRAMQIEVLQPERLNIKWATKGNYTDCGVFLMRHMETWMGVTAEKWNSGFPKDAKKMKFKINELRKKYAAAILLSESNINRDRVLKEAKELEEKKTEEAKKLKDKKKK